MNVNPANFDKKIKIISLHGETKDEDGFENPNEVVIKELYAQVTHTSGSTLIKSNASFENANTRFFFRTPKVELKTSYFIKYKDYYYTIDYINPYNEENHYTEIYGRRADLNGEDDNGF